MFVEGLSRICISTADSWIDEEDHSVTNKSDSKDEDDDENGYESLKSGPVTTAKDKV